MKLLDWACLAALLALVGVAIPKIVEAVECGLC